MKIGDTVVWRARPYVVREIWPKIGRLMLADDNSTITLPIREFET